MTTLPYSEKKVISDIEFNGAHQIYFEKKRLMQLTPVKF